MALGLCRAHAERPSPIRCQGTRPPPGGRLVWPQMPPSQGPAARGQSSIARPVRADSPTRWVRNPSDLSSSLEVRCHPDANERLTAGHPLARGRPSSRLDVPGSY